MIIPPTSAVSISDKAFDPGADVFENLRRVRSAGFTHLHFSWKWTNTEPVDPGEESMWRKALDQHGIKVLDVHGCHPKNIHLWSEFREQRDAAMRLFQSRLRLTHRLGGDAMVYHVPWEAPVTDRQLQDFLNGLKENEEVARSLGVAVALENHYLAGNDRSALEAAFASFEPAYIGFTFDPGHALISGNTDWLLKHGRDRLKVLHLNDNDATKDLHWLPFDTEGRAEWSLIRDFLRGSPYAKPLQLEVSWSPARHGGHEHFLREAFASAIRLADTVNP